MGKLGFRELKVWKRAKDLAVDVYRVTNSPEMARDFSLCDQIRRSAVSVASNIAEGDERETDKEAIRFFFIAKGSLAELLTQLEIAQEIGHLSEEIARPLLIGGEEIASMLGALIRSRGFRRCLSSSPSL